MVYSWWQSSEVRLARGGVISGRRAWGLLAVRVRPLLYSMALGLLWASIVLLVFLALLSLDIMGFFSRKNHFPVDGRVGGIIYDANLAGLC